MSFENISLYTSKELLSTPDLTKFDPLKNQDSRDGVPKRKNSRLLDSLGFDSIERRKEAEVRRFRSLNCLRSAFQVGGTGSVDSVNTEDSDTEDENILPEENRWLIACCNGQLHDVERLLDAYPRLLYHRDFIFGYTGFHWSCKLGRMDIVEFLSSKHTGKDYLETKSHGGYTPLHIAAICGHQDVIVRLIQLGANIHSRDHNGKKPKDLVKHTVAAPVQNKLGKPLVLDENIVLESGLSFKGRHDSKHLKVGESPKPSPVIERRSTKTKVLTKTWK